MEYLQIYQNRGCAARTKKGMDVGLGWLAIVLNLPQKDVSPRSFPWSAGKLVLTGSGVEAQTEHYKFFVMNKQSLGIILAATGEVSAQLYVWSPSHVHVHHSGTRKKVLKNLALMNEV